MYNEILLPDGFDEENPLFPAEKAAEQPVSPENTAPETEADGDPIDAQNAAAAAMAPVRGTGGGLSPHTGEADPFTQGFDAAARW